LIERCWNIIIEAFYAVNPWIFAGLGALYFALDALYSQYIISIGRLKPFRSFNSFNGFSNL
jgi:hypothetical protein